MKKNTKILIGVGVVGVGVLAYMYFNKQKTDKSKSMVKDKSGAGSGAGSGALTSDNFGYGSLVTPMPRVVEGSDEIMCPRNYSPVCSDGVTYPNKCEAIKSGAIKFVAGKCSDGAFVNVSLPEDVESNISDISVVQRVNRKPAMIKASLSEAVSRFDGRGTDYVEVGSALTDLE